MHLGKIERPSKKRYYKYPVLVQLLGMCPTLATSTSLVNGVGMGLSATAVLICTNIVYL